MKDLTAFSEQIAGLIDEVGSHVVSVLGSRKRAFSGTVIAPDLVITLNHVLDRETGLSVRAGDRELPARFLGRDGATDLAALRVEGLQVSPAAPASDAARVGQLLVAAGRAPDGSPAAATGIVGTIGALRSRRARHAMVDGVVRMETTPFPGFSGCLVADAQGRAVGLGQAGWPAGAALALPIDGVVRVAHEIAEHGGVRRPFLGVSLTPIRLPSEPEGAGLVVVGVEPGSPAGAAGLVVGDVLLTLAGAPMSTIADVETLLPPHVGGTVTIELLRAGQRQRAQATVGARAGR